MKPTDRRHQLPALLVTVLAGVTLAGCSAEVSIGDGDGDQAPGGDIAEKIREDYGAKTGIELTQLTCEEVEADVGAGLTCTGRNARDIELAIGGEVTETDSDGFDYSWEVVSARAPGVYYERALRRLIEQRGVALAELTCPTRVELRRQESVDCEAVDRAGASRVVAVTVTDLDGGFEYRIRDPEPEGDAATS